MRKFAFLFLLAGFALILSNCSGYAQTFSSASRATVSVDPGYREITDRTRIPVRVRIAIEENWHIQAHEVDDEDLIPTRIELVQPSSAELIRQVYPEPVGMNLPDFGDIKVFKDTIDIAVLVSLEKRPEPGSTVDLTFRVTLQACDDKSCMPPGTVEKNVSIKRTPETTEKTEAFSWLEERLADETGNTSEQAGGDFARKLNRSFIWALLLSFVWGLGASLSPCVYPMIPLTLSYFGAQTSEENADEQGTLGRSYVVMLAFVYVLGIALTYAVLGVFAALIGVEMGFALGSPWFVGFLVVLFVLLALSMMGLFEIPVPSGMQGMAGNKPGITGAFLMGAFLGIIAAPCVGPFAAAILAFIATTQNVVTGFAGMFSFGLGLGMLFLVLAIFSGSFSSISAGGGYLKHVKTFWGIVLLGVTLYFLDLLFQLVELEPLRGWLIPMIAGFLILYFGFWLIQVTRALTEEEAVSLLGVTGKSVAVVSLLIGGYLSLGGFMQSGALLPVPGWFGGGETVQVGSSGNGSNKKKPRKASVEWVTDFEEGVKKAKETGKPIFLDFYADYCAPCKIMENTVFSAPEVASRLNNRYIPVKLDATVDRYQTLKRERFNAFSLPYYTFLSSDGRHLKSFTLQKKVPKKEFVELLNRVEQNLNRASSEE